MTPMRTRTWAVASILAGTAFLATRCGDPPPPPPPPLPPLALVPPLQDAQVGERIRLQRENGDAEVYRVVAADEFWVTVELTAYQKGEPVPPVTARWHRSSFGMPDDAVIRSIDVDRIQVGERWYDCFRLSVHGKNRTVLFWISDEVPVHGVLKAALLLKGEASEMSAAKLVESSFDGQ